MTTPLRNWIKKTLIENVPVGTIWSDNPKDKRFEILTGVTQDQLDRKWFKVDVDANNKITSIHYDQSGSDSRFTTCSSFLPCFATNVRLAGRLPTRTRNWKGEWVSIGLKGFMLHTERIGWVPASVGYARNGGPKEGDFFQLGHGGTVDHVGIILGINGDTWSCVAGGAGGRGSRHDGVKRTPYQHKPHNILGWIDVDLYFHGWNGPNYGEVTDPAKLTANVM